MLQCGLAHEKIRENISLKGLVQLLLRNIQQTVLRILHRKIVDQNVESAKGLYSLLHRLKAVASVPQIRLNPQAAPAGCSIRRAVSAASEAS